MVSSCLHLTETGKYLCTHCRKPCSITVAGLLSLVKTTPVWFLLHFFAQLLFYKMASSLESSLHYKNYMNYAMLILFTQKEQIHWWHLDLALCKTACTDFQYKNHFYSYGVNIPNLQFCPYFKEQATFLSYK